jgi:alpha-beta hydrolase superfamily lysophospholipase
VSTPRLLARELRGSDGGPLRLDVRSGAGPGQARPAIVICHGFKGFKDWGFFPIAAERLARAGFTAVSFNFSGSGVGADGLSFSEVARWRGQTFSADLADLALVVDDVVAGGAPWVGLLGHSRGGGTTLLQAARDPRIRALVTWGAVSRFGWWSEEEAQRWRAEGSLDVANLRTGEVLPVGTGLLEDYEAGRDGTLDIMAAAGRIAVPWLLVHGAEDETVAPDNARRLERAAGGGARLLMVAGAGHTFGVSHPWAGSNPQFDRVLEATVAFFSDALG